MPPERRNDQWRRWLHVAVRLSLPLDLAIVVAMALSFARPLLNFNDTLIPSPFTDWEAAISSLVLARDSILHHAEFPLWNPFFQTGVPYLADPNVNLLNPIASIPTLAFGVLNGAKISAGVSIVAAGVAMYLMASVAGVSRPLRIWAGLLLAMSGSLAARIFAGHFNFVVSLPFVALAFAFAFHGLRRPGMAFPILAGLVNAILFASGQVYYAVFAAPGLVLTFLLVLANEGLENRRWRARKALPVLGRAVAMAGWTLGFAAIQLLPYIESRSAYGIPTYGLEGSQGPIASARNFFISDVIDLALRLPPPWGWWEYYSYIGYVPLVGLALSLLALRRPERRFVVIWAASLFVLYMSWAAAAYTPYRLLYRALPALYHFRAVSRTLAFATPFFILLAALGFDEALTWSKGLLLRSRSLFAAGIGLVVIAAVLGLCSYSLRDVFRANQRLLVERPRQEDRQLESQILRRDGSSTISVADRSWTLAVSPEYYENGIKRLDASWPYRFLHVPSTSQPVSIAPPPNYLITYSDEKSAAAFPSAMLIYESGGERIYRLVNSPYYAATLASADAPTDPSYDWKGKTHEAQATIASANVIEIAADPAPGDDQLLVMETFTSGWRLEIDGKGAGAPDNYGGFLSTRALPGRHTYTFVYNPRGFRYGGAITIGTVLGALLLPLWRFGSRRRWRWRA